MKNNLTFLILFLTQILVGQRLTKNGDKILGSTEDDAIFQSVQAINGNIYAVGETYSLTKGGSDGYLVILNPLGNEIVEKRFGGERDDAFYSIAALSDGTFALAGRTKSKGNGKFDAWVVYVDKDGNRVREDRVLGTSADDEFRVAVASEDGSVFFAGTRNEQKDADIWIVKELSGKTVFEKQVSLGHYVKNVKSGVSDTEGGLVLLGDTKRTDAVKGDDIWVSQIDKNGRTHDLQ